MKRETSRLSKVLQGIFLFMEILIVVLSLILVVMVLFNGRPLFGGSKKSDHIRASIHIGEIGLSIPKGQYKLTIKDHPSEDTRIEDLRGYIKTSNPKVAGDFLRAVRPALALGILFWGAAGVVICDLFRRVFKQVGRGEAFTASNVRNVHKIGVTILVATLGMTLLGGWAQYSVTNFVADHVEVDGLVIHSGPMAPDGGLSVTLGNFLLHFDLEWILVGMMILALGEAFRQGLKLKEESVLTI